MRIVDGFIRVQLSKKQPGGSGNKKFIKHQTVRIDFKPLLSKTPQISMASREVIESQFVSRFRLTCTLHGTSTRAHLDDLGSAQLIRKTSKLNAVEVSPLSKDLTMDVTFHRLLVVHSSHNNQQQMYLRFSLIDTEDDILLDSIDSARFETITRRAIEKQRQKEKLRRKNLEEARRSNIQDMAKSDLQYSHHHEESSDGDDVYESVSRTSSNQSEESMPIRGIGMAPKTGFAMGSALKPNQIYTNNSAGVPAYGLHGPLRVSNSSGRQ